MVALGVMFAAAAACSIFYGSDPISGHVTSYYATCVQRSADICARTMRTMWTRIVTPSLTPCGLAINDRPHGWSPRRWRGRVRDVARGGDHDAPSARGTG